MEINPRGYWENRTDEGHGHDASLANAIYELISDSVPSYAYLNVIDIGCGDGFYTKYLLDKGLTCEGYDGNPFTPKITNGLCKVADFSQPQLLHQADWVLSLEVGEHIPSEYEDIFIQNLVWHSWNGIILSWAIPGQGGDGHVNCRDNKYIIGKLKDKGFKFEPIHTEYLRNRTADYPYTGYWFKDTLMVFTFAQWNRSTGC